MNKKTDKIKEIKNKIKELNEKLSIKENEIKEHVNLLQRTQADFQNYMKRVEKEKQEYLTNVCEDLILGVIDVYDNLVVAIKTIPPNDENKKTVKGLTAVLRQIQKLLEERGVRKIDSMGSVFDPTKHEAAEVLDVKDKPENTIIEEIQSGYTVKDRLLRPAKVVVVKKKGGG